MLVIERVVELLTDHSVVEADADIQERDYWLVYLEYRHITAILIFNGHYSTEDCIQRGREPGSIQEGPGLWYVPDGTPVEIASFLAGWMIGRAGAPPQPSPVAELSGSTPGKPEPHGSGNVSPPSEWFSPPAFFEGQHRARLDPDEWSG
jgi:hypothetical protein